MKKSNKCNECGQDVSEDQTVNFRCDSFHAELEDDGGCLSIYACNSDDEHTAAFPPGLVKQEAIDFAKWLVRVAKIMRDE